MTEKYNQEAQYYFVYASIYIRGLNLEPRKISEQIKITPTYQYMRGEKFVTKSGALGVRKLSIWALENPTKYNNINTAILETIKPIKYSIKKLKIVSEKNDIEDAYFDILVIKDRNFNSYNFEISSESVKFIYETGFKLKLTFSSLIEMGADTDKVSTDS